jgi:thiamine biosynthesis lipoprotein
MADPGKIPPVDDTPGGPEVRTSILASPCGTTEGYVQKQHWGAGVGAGRFALVATVAVAIVALACVPGCAPGDEPVIEGREALGTVVTITAYGQDGVAVQAAVEEAYSEMESVEAALDVYDLDSEPASGAAAALNASPHEWTRMPVEAADVLAAVRSLGVAEEFSVALYGVQSLYGFEEGGRVPDQRMLMAAVGASSAFETREVAGALEARFTPIDGTQRGADTTGPAVFDTSQTVVGVDFGGAAKGLGLDRAAAILRASPAVEAAIISASSTTIAFGEKPDAIPWRIGIEDPRDPEQTTSVIEATGDIVVSTSGDYQRFFEAVGQRYHHILSPETGLPARGTQSLTVVGADGGLESDILSTALFVMGPARAATYAERQGLGLYVIDDEGQALVTPGPDDSYSFGEAK